VFLHLFYLLLLLTCPCPYLGKHWDTLKTENFKTKSTKIRKYPRQNTKMIHRWIVGILCVLLGIFTGISSGVIDKFLTIKTCGKPHIQNIMSNVTAKPGQMASFKCQVDMSCIVAYIEWYHEMDNGTEKLIKVRNTSLLLSHYHS